MSIHPAAVVAPTAKLGSNVTVGPFAIVEDDVEIGDDCIVDSHAIIRKGVKMGRKNLVHPFAVIGGNPQHMTFDMATPTGVLIGDNNIFHESVTINRATVEGESTRIGSGCFFMNNSHVGHDAVVGDAVIMATNCALGGHAIIENNVFFGGSAMVHQFTRVGCYAMVAGGTMIRMDAYPYALVGGWPVKHYRTNLIGLRRAGIARESIRAIEQAFRNLRETGRMDATELPDTAEVRHLREWIEAGTKRGIYGFLKGKSEEKLD